MDYQLDKTSAHLATPVKYKHVCFIENLGLYTV